MGYFWFLKLGLKCIDLLAWPLLALGYPLCASIQAIENDSYSDTKNLISYWILLSLIYLFEYAFVKLLEWFQLWHYFKLIIVFWLVIPDFRRSFQIYRNFVHPCISMNTQGVISKINNWKKFFVEKESFLLQAEEYIKDNGTEALEKLVSSTNMMLNHDKEITEVPALGKKDKHQNTADNLEAEAEAKANAKAKAVPTTEMKQMKQNSMYYMFGLDPEAFKEVPITEKKLLPVTSGKSLHIEVTEKKEVPADSNRNPTAPNLALNESKSYGAVDANRMAGNDYIEQSHLKVVEKREIPADTNANPTAPNLALSKNKSSGAVKTYQMDVKDVEGGEPFHSAASKKVQKEWTCAICQVTTSCEGNLNGHLHGWKDKAACEALKQRENANKEQKNAQTCSATQPGSKPKKSILTYVVKQRTVTVQQNKGKGDPNSVHAATDKTGQLNGMNVNVEFKNGLNGMMEGQKKNTGKPVKINHPVLRCNLCNVRCYSLVDLASHLKGRKHLDGMKSLAGANPNVM